MHRGENHCDELDWTKKMFKYPADLKIPLVIVYSSEIEELMEKYQRRQQVAFHANTL